HALAVQNINLSQLRDNLFRLVASLRHIDPPLDSLTQRWTNSMGADQDLQETGIEWAAIGREWAKPSAPVGPSRNARNDDRNDHL
ncbi:MAG: hypothetical protein RIC16_17490, partial [Rhodospirillales bacterium]